MTERRVIRGATVVALDIFSDSYGIEGNTQQLYVMHYTPDATTPTNVSLVSSASRNGAIDIQWYVPRPSFAGELWRARVNGAWERRGPAESDASGYVTFHDTDVVPGIRYCYRLSETGDDPLASSEACVTSGMAGTAGLAVTPTPANGRMTVSFESEQSEPVELALFDLGGRRIDARMFKPSGPGTQHIAFTPSAGIRAGVYLVRAQQGHRVEIARVVIVR